MLTGRKNRVPVGVEASSLRMKNGLLSSKAEGNELVEMKQELVAAGSGMSKSIQIQNKCLLN